MLPLEQEVNGEIEKFGRDKKESSSSNGLVTPFLESWRNGGWNWEIERGRCVHFDPYSSRVLEGLIYSLSRDWEGYVS